MGNFLFREISAVTESQRGAECAIRQKGKKTAHGLRYDCPDGRLLYFLCSPVVSHISVSHIEDSLCLQYTTLKKFVNTLFYHLVNMHRLMD